jgi:energy-coupling factor transporter ATP-binding protein EcfA2
MEENASANSADGNGWGKFAFAAALFIVFSISTIGIYYFKRRNNNPSSLEEESELNVIVCGPQGSGKASFINLLDVISKKITFKELLTCNDVPFATKYIGTSSIKKRNIQVEAKLDSSIIEYQLDTKIWSDKHKIMKLIKVPGIDPNTNVQKEAITELIERFPNCTVLIVINGAVARKSFEFDIFMEKLSEISSKIDSERLFVLLTNVSTEPNIEITDLPKKTLNGNIFSYDNFVFSTDLRKGNQKLIKKCSTSFDESKETANSLILRIIDNY